MKNDSTGLMINRHAVVTGARGFLGRHVARLLSQRGHIVLGIGHGDWPREEWEKWGLSAWCCADVTLESLKQHAGIPSTIVHCAGGGSVAFSIQDPLADFQSTVTTTAHVLEFVRAYAPACRVIYPSSASVYGTVDTLPIREGSHAAPISQYGTHKLMAEQMVSAYARQFGVGTSIVRLFSVYGAGLRKQLLWDACSKFANHDSIFMGSGDEVRDWLHVEDAAELLVLAAEHASPDCPTVNGGCGSGITVREILEQLGSFLSPQCTPAFSGIQKSGDPSRYVADIAAATAWGWRPITSWKQGVAEYVAWWKADNQ